MLSERGDRISPGQEIATVTADGAFDPRKCQGAIGARGAVAIIPQERQTPETRYPPALSPAPNSCGHQRKSAGPSGDDGAVIVAMPGRDTRRMRKRSGGSFSPTRGCTVSSCWGSASPRASSTVSLPRSAGEWPCSPASPLSAPQITEVVRYVRSGKGQARSAAGFHRGRWHDFEERGHGLFAMRVLARRATRDVFAATASAISRRPSPAAIRSTAWTEMPRAISADCHSGAGSQPQTRSAFSGPAPSGRHHLFQQMVTGFRHSFIETRFFAPLTSNRAPPRSVSPQDLAAV